MVPINFFWGSQLDVNWAGGLFFREQHVVPSWVYLAGYLISVPLVVYWPTHVLLRRWFLTPPIRTESE